MTAQEKKEGIEKLKNEVIARKEKISEIKDKQIRPLQKEIENLKTEIKQLKDAETSEEEPKPAKKSADAQPA